MGKLVEKTKSPQGVNRKNSKSPVQVFMLVVGFQGSFLLVKFSRLVLQVNCLRQTSCAIIVSFHNLIAAKSKRYSPTEQSFRRKQGQRKNKTLNIHTKSKRTLPNAIILKV